MTLDERTRVLTFSDERLWAHMPAGCRAWVAGAVLEAWGLPLLLR